MASEQDGDLAYGWVKMEDQYGEYYINLYNKQTSRIKPVRADAMQQQNLPPPPPANNAKNEVNEEQPPPNLAQPPQSPASPMQNPQNAMQHQMCNQQLYQQQWQRYYAQQYQMQQYQMQQYQMQQAQIQQNANLQQQFPPPQDDESEEESSSAGTGTDDDDDEDEEEEDDDDESDDNLQQQQQPQSQQQLPAPPQPQQQQQSQPQQQQQPQPQQRSQPQQQQQPQPQQRIIPIQPQQRIQPNPVPPIKQYQPINNDNNNNENEPVLEQQDSDNSAKILNHAQVQQYRFQPIVPPQINVPSANSNDSLNNNNPLIDISPMPSPAFAPNKLGALAAAADFTGPLPPNNDDNEGTDDVDPTYAPSLPSNVSISHDSSVAPPAPAINKQQSTIFGVMLQHADKKKHLQREDNWKMLIEGVEQNCPVQDQYSVFKAMRKVAQNLLIDDERYRTLYADNDMVQKKILGRVGGYEFLRGIGFKQGLDENELICNKVDRLIINAAIHSLETKIHDLKQRRSQWDPKYGKRGRGGVGGGGGDKKISIPNALNVAPQQQQKQQQQAMNEEAELAEVLRLSQEQHIKEMIARQQRELDFAQRNRISTKSNNIYPPTEEDDHKADQL